ncbi:hypothetical protein NEOKW01_0717 [Nematocida sp. AWRm80]|nr:hypothetical protein NEOKW01_0717 [Nematocida sp. AWRm80]
MWISVYNGGNYSIEKRISCEDNEKEEENKKGYTTPLEYITDQHIGRYRLVDIKNRVVICGSRSFNVILEWIEEGIPTLLEGVALNLDLGSYIKSYTTNTNIIIVCLEGIAVFTCTTLNTIRYTEIKRITKTNKTMVITRALEIISPDTPQELPTQSPSNTKETTITQSPEENSKIEEKDKTEVEIELIDDLEREIILLCLEPLEVDKDDDLEKELLFKRIAKRLSNTLPLYQQRIYEILPTVQETLIFMEDFLVVKNEKEYLGIPLCLIRKVEVREKWLSEIFIKDANQREFIFKIHSAEHLKQIPKYLQREGTQFKSAYIHVLLDMLEMGVSEDNSKIPNSFSLFGNIPNINAQSEYKLYLCGTEREEINITIDPKERPFLWMESFCTSEIIQTPDKYTANLEKSTKMVLKSSEQIEKDITRASYKAQTDEEISALRRVLYAFALTNNDEYLQSHSLVGSILLRTLGESGTFYALVHIFTRILPGYNGPEIYGIRRDIQVFLVLANERFPGLCSNLKEKEIELEILVTPWIAGLFTTIFTSPLIEQVFDHIACFGAVFIFRLSLAILERMYKDISRSDKTSSILKASKKYLFNNKTAPSIDPKEFSLLISIARHSNIAPDRIDYERDLYEISHRRNYLSE